MTARHHHRAIATVALVLTVTLVLWLVTMIAYGVSVGEVASAERAVEVAQSLGPLHYATYLNALVFTALVVGLFALLGPALETTHPALVRFGILFVPIYGVMNLVAYGSQVTILPLLADNLSSDPHGIYAALVAEVVQLRPTSIMGQLNGFAYAVLGIPSVTFGVALMSRGSKGKVAGWLLVANAVACVLGVVGVVAGIAPLAMGSLVGGVLWTASVPLLWLLFRTGGSSPEATS